MNNGFKSFSKKIYSKTVKLTNITANAFGMSKPSEIFYSIKDGNWSDPTMWETVSGRGGKFPSKRDDVYIKHHVALDIVATTTEVSNLYISGKFDTGAAGNKNMVIFGNLQCTGLLFGNSVNLINIALHGLNNYVNNFSDTNNRVTFSYVRAGDQPIMKLNCYSIEVYGGAGFKKYLQEDLNVTNLNIGSCIFECLGFNLTVLGATGLLGGGASTLSQLGSGKLLFVGDLNFNNEASIVFSGNPEVEFRGGITGNLSGFTKFNSGTNIWRFTTTQTIGGTIASGFNMTCPVSIEGAITLTVSGNTLINLFKPINCNNAAGSLINKANIYFSASDSLPSMTVGTFDRTSFANTVGYVFDGSPTLPYTNYWSLYIAGTGTKASLGNTVLTGSLEFGPNGKLELSTHNLEVGTTTTLRQAGTRLIKSGAGNVLFKGTVLVGGASGENGHITFNVGNPTVECRGGLATGSNSNSNVILGGTGVWSFTTNNQLFYPLASPGFTLIDKFEIASGIVVTNQIVPVITSYINGLSGTSQLINEFGNLILQTTTQPMITGILTVNTNSNTVTYQNLGASTIFDYPYWSLNVASLDTSTKTPIANLVLIGNLTVSTGTGAVATLELNNFNLTVGGTTFYNGNLFKSGAGSVLFTDNISGGNSSGNTGNCNLDFSGGNPTVQFRGGFSTTNLLASQLKTGLGTWTFSTNNQTISDLGNSQSGVWDCEVKISGPITLTRGQGGNTFNGILEGDNAFSKFDNRTIGAPGLQFKNAIRPMVTGILETNAAANIFKYNRLGNQDITGGTYKTLEFGGSGVKKLMGNITVSTAGYSVTGTATVDLNGFTITLT